MHRLLAVGFALGFTAIAAGPVRAWDNLGHEVVMTIAYAHLDPAARQTVDALTPKMSSPGHSYNPINLSCWMDDIRRDPSMPAYGLFKTWHYIDIPIDSRDPTPSFDPGTDTEAHGDAVQGIKRALVVLKGGSDPYVRDRAMALAIVEHLAGDLHQPLHCATKYFRSHGQWRDDKGGNDEFVVNGPADALKFNLHAFWDSAYRAAFDPAQGIVTLDLATDAGPAGIAEAIAGTPVPPSLVTVDIDAWARESNALARDFVYRELTATEDRKSCRLSSTYVAKARETARTRLHLAGLRLARLLNETLPTGVPPP